MMDLAHSATNKKIKKLEKQIETVYQEALVDIENKLNNFAEKYKVKEAIRLQELKDGKITQTQFDNWKKGQVFQGEQWEAKRDQIIATIHNSNSIATKIINGSMVNVFAFNANYESYDLEHGCGVNFGFGVYDNATVVKLIKDDPDLLPKWKIDEEKDYIWNKKKVNNAITQGIIQGEGISQITDRISKGLVAQNENTMKTFARTAMTEAQNAGRDQSLMNAKSKGINVYKQWMATLDGRTRDSHRWIDGEKVKVGDKWHPMKFSNGCRYPGDPEAPAHEVYNCRCTIVGDVEGYPSVFERYDNIDGKPVKSMTYKEWYKTKYGKDPEAPKTKVSKSKPKGIDYSKYGGKEVYDLLSKYKTVQDFWDNAFENPQNISKIVNAFNVDPSKVEQAIKEIQASKVTKATPKEKVKSPTEHPKFKATSEGVFTDAAYTKERKDAALWAKNSKQADDALRQATKNVWVGATSEERHAAWDYTAGSGKFNRPLRGYEGSWSNSHFKGVGNVDLNYEGAGDEIKELTNLIDRSTLQQDTWLQRGIGNRDGVVGFFGLDEDLLYNSSEEDLKQLLIGKEVSDTGFMSCGSAKGKGFQGPAVLNIYCPEGTKALYCEPFSEYGRGAQSASWDGVSDQSNFGGELETLIQRGTRFRIVKVERPYSTLYVDIEVVGQDTQM